ncbi:hypothetical protein RND71_009406 [Anisodus tanguticus]|uniref:WDR11 TPR domain-containing protein n=1 Tax=Anisodus tanguticus TaxID=243964 RepID=A0AAE1SHR8_9SOLA|nr:hypothetical protein RND71_009406 [Anisodus tanguticus]
MWKGVKGLWKVLKSHYREPDQKLMMMLRFNGQKKRVKMRMMMSPRAMRALDAVDRNFGHFTAIAVFDCVVDHHICGLLAAIAVVDHRNFGPLASIAASESAFPLQDAGCWTDAATHLKGTDYARLIPIFDPRECGSSHNNQIQQPCLYWLVGKSIVNSLDDELRSSDKLVNLPGLNPESEDVDAVGEYYGQYQRKLVHLCMDSQPFSD